MASCHLLARGEAVACAIAFATGIDAGGSTSSIRTFPMYCVMFRSGVEMLAGKVVRVDDTIHLVRRYRLKQMTVVAWKPV